MTLKELIYNTREKLRSYLIILIKKIFYIEIIYNSVFIYYDIMKIIILE